MAEEAQKKIETETSTTPVVGDQGVESTDRGLFDFLGKKEDEKKPQEEVIASEFGEKVKVSETEHKAEEHKKEEEKEKKHGGLLEKLQRTSSSSSSSSEEEEGEGEEKKKKKKEKKKQQQEEDVSVPVEKVDEAPQSEEKKGFLDKIKDKLPGQHKKTEEVTPATPTTPPSTESSDAAHEGEAKEKKGFLDKIKEKLPGYHAKTEEEKEKEKESASP